MLIAAIGISYASATNSDLRPLFVEHIKSK